MEIKEFIELVRQAHVNRSGFELVDILDDYLICATKK